MTGAGAACTARADVVCTADAGGAGVVVVYTYTGAGTAYTAGAGAVYWAATYSGCATRDDRQTRMTDKIHHMPQKEC